MKLKYFFSASLFVVLSVAFSIDGKAQCDTIAKICSDNFTEEYLSDGQQYRALLIDDQTAEFHLTLYGGSTYRFGACSGMDSGNLIFRMYDSERNELFSNEKYSLSPYWDFEINSTLNVIIEANLNEKKLSSGCAVLLVGFKP